MTSPHETGMSAAHRQTSGDRPLNGDIAQMPRCPAGFGVPRKTHTTPYTAGQPTRSAAPAPEPPPRPVADPSARVHTSPSLQAPRCRPCAEGTSSHRYAKNSCSADMRCTLHAPSCALMHRHSSSAVFSRQILNTSALPPRSPRWFVARLSFRHVQSVHPRGIHTKSLYPTHRLS